MMSEGRAWTSKGSAMYILKRRLASAMSAASPSEYFACMRMNVALDRLSRCPSEGRDSQPASTLGRLLSFAAKALKDEWIVIPVNALLRAPRDDSMQSHTMY